MTEKACQAPVVAGAFYPADPDELRAMVDGYLRAASLESFERPVKGLISPHAGYVYSGSTAAWSYRQIQGKPCRRVVVLAPSHEGGAISKGGSIFSGSAYSTPLGRIAMDEVVVNALRKRTDLFQYAPAAHRREHSLEVQLPFLQAALSQWTLIPIIVNSAPDATWAAVAGAIFEALELAGARLGEDTVAVASSDLYHGHSAQACERFDAALAGELERCDPGEFARCAGDREIQACGAGPIAIMMQLAGLVGGKSARVLHRTNSYKECAAGADYVVGYLSAAVF